MSKRTGEQTVATVNHSARNPEATPHPRVRAPAPVWDATGTRVPGAPSAILAIQRTAGNQAVMRMLDARRPGRSLARPLTAVQALRDGSGDNEVQRAAAPLHEPSDEAIRSAAAEGVRTPSTTLPHLDRIQASFGRHSIAHIQAHVGPEAARASRAMNALAYASGTHVVFGATPDLRTAAHESAHIVQQQAGVQLSGGIGRAGDPYERHANAVADAVVAGHSAEGLLEPFSGSADASQPLPATREHTFFSGYTNSGMVQPETVGTAASRTNPVSPAPEGAVEFEAKEPPAIAIGRGHHVTVGKLDGVLRLGVASEFKTVSNIADTLLAADSPLATTKRKTVRKIKNKLSIWEKEINELATEHREAQEKTRERRAKVKIRVPNYPFGPPRNVTSGEPEDIDAWDTAREEEKNALTALQEQERAAVDWAKDKIIQLWNIGKDFLPTNLMPIGEVYRDKADFGGKKDMYDYHSGTDLDPIPITWYKAPEDYPRLLLPNGTAVEFGSDFKVGRNTFGLDRENCPRPGWLLQKTMHNDSRTGQKEFNQILNNNGVSVEKNGAWVRPPLGETHGFDGDHVKDLGFGGKDESENYWPLDSTINRRAFTGYNSAYVIHYIDDEGEHKSRAIGGLVGKWFEVVRFLRPSDTAVPNDGAAAGGTPKPKLKKSKASRKSKKSGT